MNLDFSDDQKFLQDEAKKFFDKEGGLANARAVMDNSLEGDEKLWQKIIELGWTGIRIPEAYEGLGLGHLELCVVAEELGRSLAPVPFSSSVYFFTEALIKFGNEEIKSDLNSVSANDLKNAFNNKNIPEVKPKQLDKNMYNVSNSGQIFTPKTKLK